MPTLPVNIDATYGDDTARPGIKAHQQHHDVLHALNNSAGQPNGLAQLGEDGRLKASQSATVAALASTTTIGTDGHASGVATTFRFPLPSGVPSRYGLRSNVSVFEAGTGGEYKDSLLQIGYNLDFQDDPADVSNTLNFESKFRQSPTSPFQTETIFAWRAPNGTVDRRPYQFSVEYTGANIGRVRHAFLGSVSVSDSANTVQKVLLEDGATGPLRLNNTLFSMGRLDATTSAFWQAIRSSGGQVQAFLGFDGSMGLGEGGGGDERLGLKGSADLTRIQFRNNTVGRARSVYFGSMDSYGGGDLVADGSGCYFRVKHTTGYFYTKVPNAVPANNDFLDQNNTMTVYVDEAASTLKFKVRLSTGLYKTGTVTLA